MAHTDMGAGDGVLLGQRFQVIQNTGFRLGLWQIHGLAANTGGHGLADQVVQSADAQCVQHTCNLRVVGANMSAQKIVLLLKCGQRACHG